MQTGLPVFRRLERGYDDAAPLIFRDFPVKDAKTGNYMVRLAPFGLRRAPSPLKTRDNSGV